MTALQINSPAVGARFMAKRGFKVFPLRPATKKVFETAECTRRQLPLAGGIHKATSDLTTIERWLKIEPNINFGVSAHDLVILDVDMKHGRNGCKDLEALGGAPETFTVETGTGGLHLYFEGPPTGQSKLAHGVDTRSLNGYVVAPGSVFEGKSYRLKVDGPLVKLPDEWRQKIGEGFRRDHVTASTPVIDLDLDSSLQRGRRYIENEAAVAKQGNRGYTAYQVAAVLGDMGVSENAAFELMQPWNERCNPPQDEDALEEAIGNSYRYRRRPPGSASPLFDFRDLIDAERKTKLAKLLEFASDVNRDELAAWQAGALLKGILNREESATLYAETTAGKTFVAVDLSWHIALGREWHGSKVKKAPVLYVALEGVKGFRKRMLAAQEEHGDPGVWFARLKPYVSLVKGDAGKDGLAQVIAAAKALEEATGQPVGLIIIDTWAIAGDDENAAADMMAYLERRAGEIARTTGAAVLTVHHPNKGGTFRGSNAGPAGFDVILRIDQNGEWRTLVAEKVKDDASGPLFDFLLDEVRLGVDAEGDPITSCVLSTRPSREAKSGKRHRRRSMGKAERTFRTAFDKLEADDHATSAQHPDTGELGKRIALTTLHDEFARAYPTGKVDDEKKRNARARAWERTLRELPSGFAHLPDDGRGDEWIWRSDDPFQC